MTWDSQLFFPSLPSAEITVLSRSLWLPFCVNTTLSLPIYPLMDIPYLVNNSFPRSERNFSGVLIKGHPHTAEHLHRNVTACSVLPQGPLSRPSCSFLSPSLLCDPNSQNLQVSLNLMQSFRKTECNVEGRCWSQSMEVPFVATYYYVG